jgi:hypothetical protein
MQDRGNNFIKHNHPYRFCICSIEILQMMEGGRQELENRKEKLGIREKEPAAGRRKISPPHQSMN